MSDDARRRSIGELARRAGVATSAVRYYERRGLLRPDARQSGQRRYRTESLRLLIFIGMLQDAGLSLDDIDGILDAETVERVEGASPTGGSHALDDEIAPLEQARAYLRARMLCRFDHPLTECRIMGDEIDRRLDDRP